MLICSLARLEAGFALRRLLLCLGMVANAQAQVQAQAQASDQPWRHYGGAPGGGSHTPLQQINASNLDLLEVAWTFRTGEVGPGNTPNRRLTFEATPVVVGDTLFVSTAYGRVFALDAASGVQRWRFDANLDPNTRYAEAANRSVAVWSDSAAAPDAVCAQRVFFGTLDARLIALDAHKGQRCTRFNGNGEVLSRDADWPAAQDNGGYGVTSPPVVVGGLVITGSAIGDNRAAVLESGAVRAYDVRTGALRWAWQPVAQPLSAPNAWAPLSADPQCEDGGGQRHGRGLCGGAHRA